MQSSLLVSTVAAEENASEQTFLGNVEVLIRFCKTSKAVQKILCHKQNKS